MLQNSDYMLYTNISDLQLKDKRQNDLSYIYQMSRTQPRCLIDRGDELKFFADNYKNKTTICNDCITNRGGNGVVCNTDKSCPKPIYDSYFIKDFLLVPCPKPTYKNYGVCNEDKCCSKRHQLFKNVTKRKDISGMI
jgi:hypothetical protein